MSARRLHVTLLVAFGLAFGCSESAGGPEYASLAVRVETTAVTLFAIVCVFLFVMMLRAYRRKSRRI